MVLGIEGEKKARKGEQDNMETWAVIQQKGGTGKTTTAAALAVEAGAEHMRVLLVDLDPQGNLTGSTGAEKDGGSYGLITGERLVAYSMPLYDVAAASPALQTITTGHGSAQRLKKGLAKVARAYDLAIIDTPPTPGELMYNAILAADKIIIPCRADVYSLEGLEAMKSMIKQLGAEGASVYVICTQTTRGNIQDIMQGKISGYAAGSGWQYAGEVHNGVAVQEAAALKKDLKEYAPKSKPAKDYEQIYEIIRKGA